jgi:1-pyrroline-5-carboxylate dehydrogenase
MLRFASVDPNRANNVFVSNFIRGQFVMTKNTLPILDPLDRKKTLLHVADTQLNETQPFLDQLNECPKSGLHNPLKHPER